MENITFCDVESEGVCLAPERTFFNTCLTELLTDMRYVDPNFLKVFQLAQLIIEYLLHSQVWFPDKRLAAPFPIFSTPPTDATTRTTSQTQTGP